MGVLYVVAWTYYVMKVRSGPLDRDDSFTTITIVISSTSVIMIKVYMLCDVNILISWWDFVLVIKTWLFINTIDDVIGSVSKSVLNTFLFLIVCWFGEVAVKYANITNIPPT